MPYCRDCTNCLPHDGLVDDRARCQALTYVDLVTGETKNQFCSDARTVLMGDCGPDARLFVPADAFAEADATIGATALAG